MSGDKLLGENSILSYKIVQISTKYLIYINELVIITTGI